MFNISYNRRGLLGAGAVAAIGATFAAFGRSSPAAAAAERFEVTRTPAEWKRRLGPDRYRILRQAGTEAPFTSPLNKEKRRGTFACAGCALPLFSSATKYDSGTGWPSFYAALPNAIRTKNDGALGMTRTEEHCRRCGGHLGHIFDDGPRPTGKRHCVNGLSLTFKPA
ncbi:MAG: peptide-methionine (R)-S-oxide reductase MsrB [Pseudomonadota bacterium]|nr:peptide-methionine (R)-S-oxide reductase MsrB [Pseudomonadota bacterium]